MRWAAVACAMGLTLGGCMSETGVRLAASDAAPARPHAEVQCRQSGGAAPSCPDPLAGLQAAWDRSAPRLPGVEPPAQSAAFAATSAEPDASSLPAANESWASCVRREAIDLAPGPEPTEEAGRTALARCLSQEMAVYGALGQQSPADADTLMRRMQTMAEKAASGFIDGARQAKAPDATRPNGAAPAG